MGNEDLSETEKSHDILDTCNYHLHVIVLGFNDQMLMKVAKIMLNSLWGKLAIYL